MTTEDLEQKVKELTQKVQTLESQFVLVSSRLKKTVNKQHQQNLERLRNQHEQNVRQDQELNRLKKFFIGLVIAAGVWSFASERVKAFSISDENFSLLIQLVGFALYGGAGWAEIKRAEKQTIEINRTQRRIEQSDFEDDDDLLGTM